MKIFNKKISPPYPYFGSKRKVAPIILKALGNISNYVEPFAGSLSILLSNTKIPKIETINDINCFIPNFWRAVASSPEEVAKNADYPTIEADLHARHKWLIEQTDFFEKMNSDPNYFDAKIAGWWVWGMGASIGNCWLNTKGVNALPCLSSAGGGIHGLTNNIYDWMKELSLRLRRTRVCCGDWKRVVSPSITYKNRGLSPKDITGIVLDPPYQSKNRLKVYENDVDIFGEVRSWAIENGTNKNLRIVLCGYEDEYKMPEDWSVHKWKTNGGFSSLGVGQGKINAKRECLWSSPHCNSYLID